MSSVPLAMAGKSKAYECLFCDLCGSILSFDSTTYASCPLCGNRRGVKDFQGKELRCTIGPEDFLRRWGIEPFIAPAKEAAGNDGNDSEEVQQRAVVHEECPKCSHPELEYYTRQLRSADEGQTVFYECPNCHHKFSQNM